MRQPFISILLCTLIAGGAAFAERRAISPKELGAVPATGPKPPFSPGILVNNTLYVAGQVGRDLKTGQIPPDFESEVKNALNNAGLVLKDAGFGFQDVVSVQVYLTDMDLFQRMNTVYATFFNDPRPARTTVGVAKLVAGAKIEITITAQK